MFSVAEKRKIAAAVEKVLLEINHPEMPAEKPTFSLHVSGKESWSFADIERVFDEGKPMGKNPWNEVSREVMGKEGICESK
jgi:hypothetical protein